MAAWVVVIGLIIIFFAAFLITLGAWLKSDEEGKSESPNGGWWCILIGVILFFIGLFMMIFGAILPKSPQTKVEIVEKKSN